MLRRSSVARARGLKQSAPRPRPQVARLVGWQLLAASADAHQEAAALAELLEGAAAANAAALGRLSLVASPARRMARAPRSRACGRVHARRLRTLALRPMFHPALSDRALPHPDPMTRDRSWRPRSCC